MSYPYLMKESFVAITIGTKSHNIDRTHPNFDAVCTAIKEKRWADIEPMIDITPFFQKKVEQDLGDDGGLSIDLDQEIIKYHGTVFHNTLTTRIFKMWGEGFDVKPMIAFLRNLLKNPSSVAIKELYSFLETGIMPITEDGHFLAYKKIRRDYMDIFSGTFNNSVGQICEMPRNLVDDKRDNTCSHGLHFCSQSYLSSYGNSAADTRVVIVKINPADVVSIPSDYGNAKGRCWKYEVYGEVDSFTAHQQDTFDKTVYPSQELRQQVENNVDESELDSYEYDGTDINYLYEELGTHSNTELVTVFNEMTLSSLVKFRDKDSAISRIMKWTQEGTSESERIVRRKMVMKAITDLPYNRHI